MTEIKIAVMGAGGRMGQALVRQILTTDGCVVIGGIEQAGSHLIGADLGETAGANNLNIPITDDALELIAKADAIMDFTAPAATVEFAALAAQARCIHVIGTTGLDKEHETKLSAAARHATIIRSGNFSLGVNLVAALTKLASKILDDDFDIEVIEMHHRNKVDAPSGTALMLGAAAAAGRGVDLDDVADRGRDGLPGARKRGDIGFASLRGGSVVGEHSVIFAAEKERITLSHTAEDRTIFARGAVAAALWGHGKGPGIFSMEDVLDLGV
jgi:4-hydroxy-tetrahydrodipicolinate reductase